MTVSVPSLDMGLLSLGEEAQATVHLSNITQAEASWTLEERRSSPHHAPQVHLLNNPSRSEAHSTIVLYPVL